MMFVQKRIHTVAADLSKLEATQEAAKSIAAKFGRLDGLVYVCS